MDRRELLTGFSAVFGTASLGGCLSEYEEVVGDTGATTDEETPTDEETTTTESRATEAEATETEATTTEDAASDQQVALSDTSFEVVDSGCGTPTSQADVEFSDPDTVGVTGTLAGANACYVAELVDASYDSGTDTATVTVASKEPEDAEVCADCITEINYEATVTFEGGLPGTFEVVHQSLNESGTVVVASPE